MAQDVVVGSVDSHEGVVGQELVREDRGEGEQHVKRQYLSGVQNKQVVLVLDRSKFRAEIGEIRRKFGHFFFAAPVEKLLATCGLWKGKLLWVVTVAEVTLLRA